MGARNSKTLMMFFIANRCQHMVVEREKWKLPTRYSRFQTLRHQQKEQQIANEKEFLHKLDFETKGEEPSTFPSNRNNQLANSFFGGKLL